MKLYSTVFAEARAEQEIERSKFITTVRPVNTREEAEEFFAEVRKEFKDATHNVPAMVIGDKMQIQWASDAGEPQGTRGAPIVQMLVREGITNTALVVTRYFGGIKLGIPGLIRAYRTSSADAIANARIVEKVAARMFRVSFGYMEMNGVMKIVKELGLTPCNQDFGMACSLDVAVRLSAADDFIARLSGLGGCDVTEL